MGSDAVWVCAGKRALWMARALGSLVGTANGLTWHPNPFVVAIFQDLQELGMPCGSACGSVDPLGARFVVEDVLTHLPRWESGV